MNFVKFNIHNKREGILTVIKSYLTCISDQQIIDNDVLMHPQYTRIAVDGISTLVVKEVSEERPSQGEWVDKPSTFRRILYKRESIPFDVVKQAGYAKSEIVTEGGKQVEKTFLMLN